MSSTCWSGRTTFCGPFLVPYHTLVNCNITTHCQLTTNVLVLIECMYIRHGTIQGYVTYVCMYVCSISHTYCTWFMLVIIRTYCTYT